MTAVMESSRELPNGWTWATLGDIGVYVNGRAFKESEWSDTGRPIIRIQDLTGSRANPNRFAGAVEARHSVSRGDLLISWAATLGVYWWQGEEAVLNQHIFKVESYIDRRFHFYLVQHVLEALRIQAHGSGMVHITKSKFERTPVPLPPLAEQRRIVAAIEEHLSRLDAAEAGLRRSQLLLPRFRAAVLADALRRAAELSKGGGSIFRRIEDCAVQAPGALTDGPFGSKLKTEHYTSSGARVIRLQNVGDGRFVDEEAYVSMTHFETLRRHEARVEDVIIAALGERLPRACLVPHGLGPAIVKADCFRLRPDRDVARPRWLEIALNAEPTRERASLLIKGIGRPRLNLAAVRKLEIPLPDLETQDRLVSNVERSLSLLESLQRSGDRLLERCAQMRNAVFALAFSGQLLPQVASDEPASTLLARIRAERAATPSPARAPRRRRPRSA